MGETLLAGLLVGFAAWTIRTIRAMKRTARDTENNAMRDYRYLLNRLGSHDEAHKAQLAEADEWNLSDNTRYHSLRYDLDSLADRVDQQAIRMTVNVPRTPRPRKRAAR